MKKVICFLMAFLMCTNVYALDISSKYAVLYNLNDNTVVYEMNKDEKTSIASLTKIMTCLVAIEHIDNMDEYVTITNDEISDLISLNAYVIGLKVGDKVTIKDLLYGMMLPSGADAARALAISLAGDENTFVSWMNDKATELNLNLHFANVIGLDDTNNYGTVNDVAKLLMEPLKNDEFKEIFESNTYTLSNGMKVESAMKYSADTYKLDVSYIIGSKTGYTNDAGKCLASVAYDSKNDITYMLVTTNASTSKTNAYHVLDATKIYNYYFNNYKYHIVYSTGDTILSLKVKYSNIDNIDIVSDKDIKYYYDNSYDSSKITTNYRGIEVLTPNNKVGDKLGSLDILYDGNIINTIDIYLNTCIRYSFIGFIVQNIKLLLLLILIIILFILASIKLKYKKKKH